MPRSAPAILLLLALSACSGAGRGPAPSASPAGDAGNLDRPLPSPVPEVVARVNGVAISLAQIVPIAKGAYDRVPPSEQAKKRPGILRRALNDYVDRELLVQEALARGLKVDGREVEWAYDQMRREHPDEDEWKAFLARQGLDPESLRAELRVQRTVTALLAQEVSSWPVPEADARAVYDANPQAFAPPGASSPPPFEAVRAQAEAEVRAQHQGDIRKALLDRLRAKARIEIYL
jgi:hypothetical protein